MDYKEGEVASVMKIFPVVHIDENNIFASANEAEKAFDCGADGVYLIDHNNGNINTKPLFDTYREILESNESRNRYIGLNILGLSPYDAMLALLKELDESNPNGLTISPSGLWVDNMRDNGLKKLAAIELRNSDPRLEKVKLLGGIAFKYTKTYTNNPILAMYEMVWLEESVDVIVTSGEMTVNEPSVEKIKAMKKIAGEKPIAIAGGISNENIKSYEGLADMVLVSSSVETYPGSCRFKRLKLEELIQKAHSLTDT